MACQWELFRNTRAPMRSQQQQITLCACGPCVATRLLWQRMGERARNPGDSAGIQARFAVLAWKPEPPPEPERAA